MNAIEECRLALDNIREGLKKDPDYVIKLLKKAGILTPTGRLSKRYKDDTKTTTHTRRDKFLSPSKNEEKERIRGKSKNH